MIKRLKIKLTLFLVFTIAFTVSLLVVTITEQLSLLVATTSTPAETTYSMSSVGLSAEVERLRPQFLTYMKEVGMPEKYIDLMLAVCMQESGGRVADVMQSSESLGHSLPNQIGTDASIKQGVKYMWENMKKTGADKSDDELLLKTAVQAYNFGGGFIPFTKDNGYKYSKELAQQFSAIYAVKMGWSSYGDVDYIDHVWRYLRKGNGGSSQALGDFQKIFDTIKQFDGQPYVFGGKNPSMGFDCSGIVSWAYAQQGITFPSYTVTQWEQTVPIERSEAKAGDLIFFKGTYGSPDFISHIEFYIDEKTMFGSNSSGVGYHDPSDAYWQSHFAGIRRLVK